MLDFIMFCAAAVGILVLSVGLAAFASWILGKMDCFSSEEDLSEDFFEQHGDP
jgi:hypothetical protein